MINKMLLDAIILDVEFICDYCQLFTSMGMVNIYNPILCELEGKVVNIKDVFNDYIFQHQIVTEKYVSREYYEIYLDDKCKIVVSLLEKDYISPEAVSIHFNDGKIMIL